MRGFLRSSLFILLLSCFGLDFLLNNKISPKGKILATSTIFIALTTQAYFYTHHYFTIYPNQSIKAYESYDFKSDITQALKLKPQEIIISSISANPYIYYAFYENLVPNHKNIPIKIDTPIAQPNTCIIYFIHFMPPPQQEPLPYKDYSPPDNDTQLRCYK